MYTDSETALVTAACQQPGGGTSTRCRAGGSSGSRSVFFVQPPLGRTLSFLLRQKLRQKLPQKLAMETSQTRRLLPLSSLRSIEEKLTAGRFMRIHHSYMVRLGVGRGRVPLAGETLPVSAGYREAFDQLSSR